MGIAWLMFVKILDGARTLTLLRRVKPAYHVAQHLSALRNQALNWGLCR